MTRCSNADDIAVVLRRHFPDEDFFEIDYTPELTGPLDSPTIIRHGELVTDCLDTLGNSLVQKAAANAFDQIGVCFKEPPLDPGIWADEQAKKLRAMMRHVVQATAKTKDGKKKKPKWLTQFFGKSLRPSVQQKK